MHFYARSLLFLAIQSWLFSSAARPMANPHPRHAADPFSEFRAPTAEEPDTEAYVHHHAAEGEAILSLEAPASSHSNRHLLATNNTSNNGGNSNGGSSNGNGSFNGRGNTSGGGVGVGNGGTANGNAGSNAGGNGNSLGGGGNSGRGGGGSSGGSSSLGGSTGGSSNGGGLSLGGSSSSPSDNSNSGSSSGLGSSNGGSGGSSLGVGGSSSSSGRGNSPFGRRLQHAAAGGDEETSLNPDTVQERKARSLLHYEFADTADTITQRLKHGAKEQFVAAVRAAGPRDSGAGLAMPSGQHGHFHGYFHNHMPSTQN